MMRILVAFVSLSVAMAFQVAPNTHPDTISLQMGLLDNMFQSPQKVQAQKVVKKSSKKKSDDWVHTAFKEAFHGHGSAEKDLDSMYQSQQKMLEERRKLFGKDGMRAKYKNTEVDHLRDIALHKHDPAMLNQKEDDAMYVDEGNTGFSFPWSSKLKP